MSAQHGSWSPDDVIEFAIDGSQVDAVVTNVEHKMSPHTGRELAVLEVQFQVAGEIAMRERVSAFLHATDARVTLSDGTLFGVAHASYSYSGDSAMTAFTVVLGELEEISAERLVLAGSLVLTPYKYKERLDGDAIVIEMLVRTVGADTDALEKAIADENLKYFPVIREGVKQEALQMRFGQCLWQDDGDARKHMIVLVEQHYDDLDRRSAFRGFNEPEMARSMEAIASLQELLDRLVRELVESRVLSDEKAALIRNGSVSVDRSQLRQFRRTDAIEDYFD